MSARSAGTSSSASVPGTGINTGIGPTVTNFVTIKPVEVPEALQAGEKFIKWDEESGQGTPVTLRVDPKGFYLHWIDQNNESDLLDIATIRDTRTGKLAKIPKEPKLRQIVTLGSQDTLEEKTVTVVCASDFVNYTFINFCCTKKEIARFWCDTVMGLAYNLTQIHGTTMMFLTKAHAKLTITTDKAGKIPIRNIIRIFAQNKDDRKRVEKALDVSGLPSGKNDTISLEKFQFEDFFTFYKNLTQRSEIEKVFNELVGIPKRHNMTVAQLVDFLNRSQRDPRKNEILYPYASADNAKEIISQYEPNKYNVQKHQLSWDGFLRYLLSDDNNIVAQSSFDLCSEMEHPFSHYFINSSHNTYLTGHQLTGRSSVEIYRQCLLAGCRCVELDFWNGYWNEEPIIVHGYTFVGDVSAKEVLEAIADSAFKTSDFPVILSFENHCNPRQQAKIATYCREIFGDMLLDLPLDTHKLEPGVPLPSPNVLRRKIIIKNKKKHHHHHHKKHPAAAVAVATMQAAVHDGKLTGQAQQMDGVCGTSALVVVDNSATGNGDVPSNVQHTGSGSGAHAPMLQARQGSKESTGTEDEESSSGDEDGEVVEQEPISEAAGDPSQANRIVKTTDESEAGAEISALVNYVQPVHFSKFDVSKRRNRCYEMSSFDERQATTLLKTNPVDFVNYNKSQLARVYPAGTRFDSSNFMPQLFWNTGCQLVALNYQTLDLAMQLNLGIFEYNLRCGMLLKPEFMRRKDRTLDPFAESTVDGIIAGTVKITIISGQFLTDRRASTYVEVDMYGLPADTVRKRFKTKTVNNNGINPYYDEEPFVFKKVVLPELASIRITVYEEGGRFIGHRVLPVMGLCPGYRHVNLRTEIGQPLPLATLFLHIVVNDYVPDGFSDFAEALANPIKYQSDLEKREKQLSVLTEDMELSESDECGKKGKKESKDLFIMNKEPSLLQNTTASLDIDSSELLSSSPTYHSSSHAHILTTALSLDHATDSKIASSNTTKDAHAKISVVSTTSSIVSCSIGGGSTMDELIAEPLDKILENKLVREKKLELDKKLESIRKKHEKKKISLQTQKSSDYGAGGERRYMVTKLVKRLSSKNIVSGVFSTESPSSEPLTSVIDGVESSTISSSCASISPSPVDQQQQTTTVERSLPRSQSERLIAAHKDYVSQERDLREKYHEVIYGTAEKLMKASQGNQIKIMKSQFERETADLMRKLQVDRREEMKELAKKHKDRDELVRVKREKASAMIQSGVLEREKMGKAFQRRMEELQRQHEAVRIALEESRTKTKEVMTKDFDSRLLRIESAEQSSGTTTSGSTIQPPNTTIT